MNREDSLQILAGGGPWDVLVIGGGASGLGAAVDAAARGYRTALVEAHDFAKGTSSRSTKLIHGGVRYLRQGNISLVRDSLRERAYLLRNAPRLTRRQSFIVPASGPGAWLFYGAGLKFYDKLAGRLSLGPSELLSRKEALHELPGVRSEQLRGGVRYFDAQFDDARLALALAQLLHDLGGTAVNYLPVVRLIKEGGKIRGASVRCAETSREYEIRARVVINATGAFTDELRRLDEPASEPLVNASQGAHIVVDSSFLPGANALMVPKTRDGRVLFAIPWEGRVVIGTTDTAVSSTPIEPRPFEQEIEFLLEHAALYLARPPGERDILSAFAGLRPLIKGGQRTTAKLSRDHAIFISDSGLVTITGGKWTTYRKMGEDVVTRAASLAGLPPSPSRTREMPLPVLGPPGAPSLAPEVIADFARGQMARTVEDILARRTRLLFTDARAAIEAAPAAAASLAKVIGRDAAWTESQVQSFRALAERYLWR